MSPQGNQVRFLLLRFRSQHRCERVGNQSTFADICYREKAWRIDVTPIEFQIGRISPVLADRRPRQSVAVQVPGEMMPERPGNAR